MGALRILLSFRYGGSLRAIRLAHLLGRAPRSVRAGATPSRGRRQRRGRRSLRWRGYRGRCLRPACERPARLDFRLASRAARSPSPRDVHERGYVRGDRGEGKVRRLGDVGEHGKTGSGGFAAHTVTLGIEVALNGRAITEVELKALQWGQFGVPRLPRWRRELRRAVARARGVRADGGDHRASRRRGAFSVASGAPLGGSRGTSASP